MNIRNKKRAIYGGRNNWKALSALETESFGFTVEGPNTYIWTNNNATPSGVIAVKDKVDDGRCFKVVAKSYELFKGSWFVTHTNGDVYYLMGCETTLPYFFKYGYEAFLVKGNNVKYKKAKKGDYKVPHLCYGWSVLSKEYIDYLKKEIEIDKKESWYELDSSLATTELQEVEAYINHSGVKLWHTNANS